MHKPLIALLATLLGVSTLFSTDFAWANRDMAELYFSDTNPALTEQEQQALAIANKWKGHNTRGMAPSSGKNGVVSYLFGVQQPSVVCAVLQVCDVALQAGEQVNSINLGDTARWSIEPAITGGGANEVQHLIIKPMDVGLETSLVVTTDRRAYHIRLRSHRSDYMPQVRESLFLRKIFPGFLLEKSAKNYATANAFGCPDSSSSPRLDPTRGRNIGSK